LFEGGVWVEVAAEFILFLIHHNLGAVASRFDLPFFLILLV